jgi:hypothetical protein
LKEHLGSLSGCPAETAVIETQRSMAATGTELPDIVEAETVHDSEKIRIDTNIFSNAGNLYRMVTMVQTSAALRIMNPLDSYRGAMLAERCSCSHELPNACSVRPWSINHVLLGWNSYRPPEEPGPHICFVEDDNIKQNVALAYSVGNCITQGRHCCLNCIRQHALRKGQVGILRSVSVPNKRLQFK